MAYKYCWISATINSDFSFELIQSLLEKGLNLEFQYGQLIILDKDLNCDFNPLTIDQIITALELTNRTDDVFPLTIEMSDSNTDISFGNKNGKLNITFSFLSPQWSRKYCDDEVDFDHHRYANLLLNFLNDYKILNMEILLDN